MTRVRYECVGTNGHKVVVETLAQAREYVKENGGQYKAVFTEDPTAKNLNDFWKM